MRKFGQAEGTKGGNSTKQVRFDYDLPHHSVITHLRLRKWDSSSAPEGEGAPPVERLPSTELRRVTALHIRRAADRLVAGEDAPNFAESRDYDVIADGQLLAPKKVFGLALEQALGIEAFPGHFAAGWGQPCFELLEAAGYRIVEKAEASGTSSATASRKVAVPPDPEELSWAEGSTRLASHLSTERHRAPKASAQKRLEVRATNNGRLTCENPDCLTDWYAVFPATVADAVFEIHHTVPVASMPVGHATVLEDLQCLCASCHRAEHRRMALAVGSDFSAIAK